jgi:CTP synthase
MVIEYARNVLNLKDANSSEFDQKSKNLVIDFLPGQMKLKETGASMRLGNYPCIISRKSKVFEYYKKEEIMERHRHRYEVNNLFKEKLEKEGLISVGTSPDGNLVEIMEVANHPFMIGSQFHPEFLSRPDRPHPLFYGFVSAVNETVVEGDQIRLIQ